MTIFPRNRSAHMMFKSTWVLKKIVHSAITSTCISFLKKLPEEASKLKTIFINQAMTENSNVSHKSSQKILGHVRAYGLQVHIVPSVIKFVSLKMAKKLVQGSKYKIRLDSFGVFIDSASKTNSKILLFVALFPHSLSKLYSTIDMETDTIMDIKRHFVFGFVLLTALLKNLVANINFIVIPRSQSVVFGNDLYLHCLFSQTSETDYNTTVEWNLNGGKRPLNSSIFSNNTLLVPKMTAGYLDIKPFQTNPLPVNLIEGDNSSLECITGESSPPAEIYWERNGEIFLGGTQINSTFKTFIPYGLIGQFYMKLVLIGSPVNSGMYNCVARNKALGIEVKSLKVFFNVTATEKPPYIDSTLHRSNIISPRNLPLVIDCPVRGHPFPEIKWYKNNEILRFDNRIGALNNGSLYISDLQIVDDGYYTCHDLEIDFVRQPYSIFAIAGQPTTLPCSPPISFPLSSVVWYKDDRPMAYRSGEQSVFIVDPNNGIWDLFFSNIQKLDEGNYFCVAVNNYSVPSTRTSKVAEISVGGAPILVQKPTDASVVKGQGVKVTCMVDGDPFPTITWLLDKLSVVIDSTVMLRLQNQELHISNINKTREGMYTCRARNIYGIVEAQAYVQVLVPPVVTRKLSNTTVNLGVGVILTCDVYGDPKPDIIWYKDGAKIQPAEGITLAYDRFYIKNVSLSSSGLYGCQATNKAGSVSTEAYLIVKVKPYYISGPVDRNIIMGDSLTFTCEVEGYPEPTMDWLYNGTQLFPPGVLVSLDSKQLSISSVNWAHVGSYTCVAANMQGTSTQTGIVSLHVPPWVVDIVGNPIVYENKDMELICQISGIPIPTIQWYRYGNTITASPDGRIYFPAFNRLGIKIIQTSDAGQYSCTAGNSIGTSEKSVQVFVIEAPVPPVLSDPTVMTAILFQCYIDLVDGTQTTFEILNLLPGTEYMFTMAALNPAGEGGPSEPRSLKVIVIESRTVTLQWLIPQVTNGQIRKYQILYKERSSVLAPSTVQFDVITVEASISYAVENLKPYTEYEFLVRAATIQGDAIHWGNLSNSIQIRTTAAVKSPYSVQIKWQEVAKENQNGPIQKYHIKFWPQKSPEIVKLITVPNTEQSADISELLPWRFYSFAVEAENDGGRGPSTDSFTVRTHAAAPSKPPVSVMADPLSASVVMVSFEVPDPESWNSELSGFYIEFVAMVTTTGSTSIVNSTMNSLSLNIRAWTYYKFKLSSDTH
ncbi:hypothetical protein KUTeg_021559 [Tegillarca granosa]|uniref:Uncharacterized protein n=1 Tax=Tegillarca granosa TaxID=220873 RepID=A0ABQ9E960_TEGGR|nr:hypothetical protein KUTeg_021559 [Tegillarca granosa]